jgi:hypothetical protein
MINRRQPKLKFEESIEKAKRAIDSLLLKDYVINSNAIVYGEYVSWLNKLLNILKEQKYATIQSKEGNLIDVQNIDYTYTYASFFDVFNHLSNFDITIDPIITNELKNPLIYYEQRRASNCR